MKKLLNKLTRIPNFVWIAVAAAALLLDILRRIFIGNGCGFLQLFGIPCPACGMTRAFISILKLDFLAAFSFNPAFPTVPIAALACVLSFADKRRRRLWLILFAIDVAILLAVWIVRLSLGIPIGNA